MNRLFTFFAFILLTSSAVFSQTCSDQLVFPQGRLILTYATTTEAQAVIDNTASVDITRDGGVTENFLVNQTVAAGGGRFRVRLTGATGFSDPFTGTIVLNLVGGGTLTCTYDANGDLVLSQLPVSFLSFKGQQTERQIDLHWATASELNNEGFEVVRGQEINQQIRWESIGFIEGNGTTQEKQDYSFLDKTPAYGVNYYRLKQMDFDGQYDYSSTVAVEYGKKDGSVPVGIFPNPAREQLTLIDGEGMATIYNALGQPVKQLIVNSNQETISLSELHNGQYILRVLKDDGTVITQQFSKMN